MGVSRKREAMRRRTADERVPPPVTFVVELHHRCGSPKAVAEACRCTPQLAAKLYRGDTVRYGDLSAAMAAFYALEADDDIFVCQLRQIATGGSTTAARMLRALRSAARFVQDFRGCFTLPEEACRLAVFSPKDVLADLSRLYVRCKKCLERAHRLCPQYDGKIFRDAPGLYRTLTRYRRQYNGEPTEPHRPDCDKELFKVRESLPSSNPGALPR